MEPLTLPGTLDSLGAIAKYIKAATTAAGLDKKTSYRLRLAVDEIATNIITHGYAEAGLDGVLELSSEMDEKCLTIRLEDTGAAYDSTERQTPDDLTHSLGERQTGGLGVFLAIQSVDKFLYERIGDRNWHTFIVNRSTDANES